MNLDHSSQLAGHHHSDSEEEYEDHDGALLPHTSGGGSETSEGKPITTGTELHPLPYALLFSRFYNAILVTAIGKWALPRRKNPHIVVNLQHLMGFQDKAPMEQVYKRQEYLAFGRVVCLICAKPLTAGIYLL